MNELERATVSNTVLTTLQAAGRIFGGHEDISPGALWELVTGDSLASAYFVECIRSSLGFDVPEGLLQCPSVHEFIGRLAESCQATSASRTQRRPYISGPPIKARTPRVAIIGASCRLPGGVTCLADLWTDVLLPGVDAVTQIPAERWNADFFYEPNGGEGLMYVNEGGFVSDADAFDNHFFEVPDKEAMQMDPQQRLLLEVSYESMAPLGRSRQRLASDTAVFIGCSCADWFILNAKRSDDIGSCGFIADLQHAMLANRVSYCMNLGGASITIDTATSSSIVAFCTAVKHIETGSCTCALAGASQLILAPEVTIALCNLGMLSRKGRCSPFDEGADGFIRSEGIVVFALASEDKLGEILESPIAHPLAYVRGHAIAHCGKSFSTTAPSEEGERRVVQDALAKANLEPSDIDYIEAHGTGTRMGDSVEMQSLAAVFSKSHEATRPLMIGSIKGNIGHCEGSSGAAGICKAILTLIHRSVPATLHFNRLSGLIDRTPQHYCIPRTTTKCLVDWRPLVVGVSSFGVGGCNGHVILEGSGAAVEDYELQLNVKAHWKKNRFPWSHLISYPVDGVSLSSSDADIADTTFSRHVAAVNVDESLGSSSLGEEYRNNGLSLLMSTHDQTSHSSLPKCVRFADAIEETGCIESVVHAEGSAFEVPCSAQMGTFHLADQNTGGMGIGNSGPPMEVHRRAQIFSVVERAVKEALKRDCQISPKTPFVEAGIDSMTALEVRDNISRQLQLKLPATALYDHPCISDLAAYLERELCGATSEAHSSPYGLAQSSCSLDVGVISLACRFPKAASSPSDFWEVLRVGKDCIQHIPLDRFDVERYQVSDQQPSGGIFVSQAGTYEGMALFDNAAFGICSAEAYIMDPHQRVLLETVYECLGRVVPHTQKPLDIAMIIGCCNNDWVRQSCAPNIEKKSFSGPGEAASIISNRVSYMLNLKGPSMTIDTACSSSLVAVDVAKQLLMKNQCEMAVAGGIHVLINHHVFEQYCKAGMLSVDGRCKTFDASANGYVRSEGCGAVLLKALPRDKTAPTSVYAWLRGAANNHVGRSASLTAPNGPAQQAVIRAALRDARVHSPADVAILEAHGTGTSLGDPIEVGAFRAVYCRGLSDSAPFVVGALKSLMGHAEGAAGIAGLIKLILVLQHRTATPNLHLNVLNPHIDLSMDEGHRELLFPSKCVPLSSLLGIDDSEPLLGAVSSFGFGGSNAHAIVEVGPTFKPTWVKKTDDSSAASFAEKRSTVVWLFAGQGSQYLDMASAYFRNSKVFIDALSACTHCLKEIEWFPADGPQSIEELIYGSATEGDRSAKETLLSQTLYSQVAVFSVEWALSKVLMDRGLMPDVVIGHSLGEFAAATVAGVMEWQDALRLVARRAQLLNDQPQGDGIMVACRVPASAVQNALAKDLPNLARVSLAGDNGPQSITISGAREEVEILLEHLGTASKSRKLSVSHAFHSPLMAGAVSAMESLARATELRPARVKFASTVRGRIVEADEMVDSKYWAEQLTLPVRFREAVEAAVRDADVDRIVFIEVGPQRTLVNLASQIVGKAVTYSCEFIHMCGRDHADDSGDDVRRQLEDLQSLCGATGSSRWNHRRFPFPLEGYEKSKKQSVTGLPKREEHQLPHHLWKMQWTHLDVQRPLERPCPTAKTPWLFCGVPAGQSVAFKTSLKSSGIDEAIVYECGSINADSALPGWHSADAVIFVGGLWPSHSKTLCIDDLRLTLLSYCKSADMDPSFNVPFCVVTANSSSAFGLATSEASKDTSGAIQSIEHSGLLGMCRTSRLEIERVCKRPFKMLFANVEDCNPNCLQKAWEWINLQLNGISSDGCVVEEDILIANDTYFAPRMVHVPLPALPAPSFISSTKSYLITGGTGGLGLSVAKWLIEKDAGLVVLISRSGKPSEALQLTDMWKTVEKSIDKNCAKVMACDVGSRRDVARALSMIHHNLPIGGIFHCAGFEGASTLSSASMESIDAVFKPKVNGAWNLHFACEELGIDNSLDIFLLFSSISTLPGNDALATYAAANSCLDSLAYWRRAQNLKCQSVQWGPWGDVGMVTRSEKLSKVFASRGIKPFTSEEGLLAMAQAMQLDEACVCALSVEWKKYNRSFGYNVPPSMAQLEPKGVDAIKSQESQLSRDLIEAAVLEATQMLNSNNECPLSLNTRLDDLGLDSLGSVELRNVIQEKLGVKLPASLLLEFSTLAEVVDSIVDTTCGADETNYAPAIYTGTDAIRQSEGFAVIGMACRLPGNSNTPEEFWNMLLAGTDCVADIPWQRFNIEPFFDPKLEENKCYVREAALLDNADLFDHKFFRMSERQARNIDPQQRVLLEVSYETFVDAQYQLEDVKGRDVGVFCATYMNDYQLTSLAKGEDGILAIGEGVNGGIPRLGEASGYPEPGALMCLIPNRISYTMGVIGPSVGIDTACASGLVALDMALMKMKCSECSMAFVGAVSLILSPALFIGGSKTRQFSKSGRCRTFDAAADGLVRGEGAVGFVLAPLSTARSEGKFVHAIVRGAATTHYGHGARLTAPNTRALARALNQALNDGRVDQSLVRYYEAHGTATVLGDIIEMNALNQVFGKRSASTPLFIGTAHNNIGHLDSAAALAAVLKTILTLKHRHVPRNIQFKCLHPDISFIDTSKLIYTNEAQDINVPKDGTRIFGANLAYGLGGTVVAAITEEGDDPAKAPKIVRHKWNHTSFPLDAQKFVFIMGAAAQVAQDRKYTPQDDINHIVETLCKSQLSPEHLTTLEGCTPPSKTSVVLLTGATGLTGSQILLRLLDRQLTHQNVGEPEFLRVYCLVQARDREHAMYRIVDAVVGRGGTWKPRYFHQVIPIVGDLKAPRLGISAALFDKLSGEVDAVYHAARNVDFFVPYESIRKVNVLSLQPMIELCTTKRLKHLHILSDFAAHIQYLGAFAGDLDVSISETLSVPEAEMGRMENQMPPGISGYPWGRWAVEEVLARCQKWVGEDDEQAHDSSPHLRVKFPFTVYRLPNSAVYFSNGRVDFGNPYVAMASAALQHRMLPPGVLPLGPPFLTTPIDTSAAILVDISFMSERPCVIHIVNPVGIRREAIKNALQQLDIKFSECSEDDLLRSIEKNQNSSPAYPLLPMMRFWRKYWFSDDLDRPTPFPIEVHHMLSVLPKALELFPSPSEVFMRMAAYCLKDHHLLRDPFDVIFSKPFMKQVVGNISRNSTTIDVSPTTRAIVKAAATADSYEDFDMDYQWSPSKFISDPIYSLFLPRDM